MSLNIRAERLLKTLVERYIVDGQPVGSRTLARRAGLELSPATVRNIMADLEDLGLVRSPHTSAGRVPTERGYRVFVDSLLQVKPLESQEVQRVKSELQADGDPHQLIETASHLLSELCCLAGIVMVPRSDEPYTFRCVDFVQLAGARILVILVTRDGQVYNRIITADREYSASELTQAANYFNESYAGVDLGAVREALAREMEQASEDMQRLIQLAVEVARTVPPAPGDADAVVLSGEANLMDVPDLGDIRKLRRLFEAFTTKRDLLFLLDRSLRAGGVKIFIGSESGYEAFADCSVVTAPYAVDGRVVGTLGVIGPTRMAYEHVIPIVDITSRLLSAALSGPDALERRIS